MTYTPSTPPAAPDSLPRTSGPDAAALDAAVGDLDRQLREQVKRALGVELDGSVTSLAFLDHYLGLARSETRAPILDLLAASAGVYFGELVRREFGGTWVGRAGDPRNYRLLLGAQYLHFTPVALALAAILGREPDDEDIDCALHLDIRSGSEPDGVSDATFIEERLMAVPPVPEDQFYTLTTRFETIALIIDLLAQRRAQSGSEPYTYTLDDYSHALS
ncbi:hypothetical protein [Nannocystis radixulma]|uniref:Uncharacterized protein n=1 Tax=Nannocystis radixulma TaxID=2995305 RepID=A0ABT5BPH0_9BACT|nr:hypothetical protein [Nannocystis radixulma]MDC0676065.1 hypothetical protein [Nannocystis radixulma]